MNSLLMFVTFLGRYREWLGEILSSQAILAPLLLLFVTETGIPIFIPNDFLIAYAGFGASQGTNFLFWVVYVMTMVVLLGGSSILFFVGMRWGKPIIDKLGKFLFIHPNQIEKAQRLLEKYGAWAIIIGRHIAGVRVPLTIFAAASGVKYRTFLLSTLVTTAPWVFFYLYLGNRYGATIQQAASQYTLVTIVSVACLVLLALLLHFRGRIRRQPPSHPKNT